MVRKRAPFPHAHHRLVRTRTRNLSLTFYVRRSTFVVARVYSSTHYNSRELSSALNSSDNRNTVYYHPFSVLISPEDGKVGRDSEIVEVEDRREENENES